MNELLTLQGVARKTANVVLGVAYEKAEGVVVDTHVQRLSRRLDFSKEEKPEKIEQDLMKLVSAGQMDPVGAPVDSSRPRKMHGYAAKVLRVPDRRSLLRRRQDGLMSDTWPKIVHSVIGVIQWIIAIASVAGTLALFSWILTMILKKDKAK